MNLSDFYILPAYILLINYRSRIDNSFTLLHISPIKCQKLKIMQPIWKTFILPTETSDFNFIPLWRKC